MRISANVLKLAFDPLTFARRSLPTFEFMCTPGAFSISAPLPLPLFPTSFEGVVEEEASLTEELEGVAVEEEGGAEEMAEGVADTPLMRFAGWGFLNSCFGIWKQI